MFDTTTWWKILIFFVVTGIIVTIIIFARFKPSPVPYEVTLSACDNLGSQYVTKTCPLAVNGEGKECLDVETGKMGSKSIKYIQPCTREWKSLAVSKCVGGTYREVMQCQPLAESNTCQWSGLGDGWSQRRYIMGETINITRNCIKPPSLEEVTNHCIFYTRQNYISTHDCNNSLINGQGNSSVQLEGYVKLTPGISYSGITTRVTGITCTGITRLEYVEGKTYYDLCDGKIEGTSLFNIQCWQPCRKPVLAKEIGLKNILAISVPNNFTILTNSITMTDIGYDNIPDIPLITFDKNVNGITHPITGTTIYGGVCTTFSIVHENTISSASVKGYIIVDIQGYKGFLATSIEGGYKYLYWTQMATYYDGSGIDSIQAERFIVTYNKDNSITIKTLDGGDLYTASYNTGYNYLLNNIAIEDPKSFPCLTYANKENI